MEIADFFIKPELVVVNGYLEDQYTIRRQIDQLTGIKDSDIKNYNIAILGVPEFRNSELQGSAESLGAIRNKLYSLSSIKTDLKIVDLGDLRIGSTIKETYTGLKLAVDILLDLEIFPVVIGGSQDLSISLFESLEKHNEEINFVTLDSSIDYSGDEELFHNKNFLNTIFQKRRLFRYANLATQKYLNRSDVLEKIRSLYFENYRLGVIRDNVKTTEPVLRDCHFLSVDISSVKQTDAFGQIYPSPNGLNSDEFCQLARYAGLSVNMKVLGLFNYLRKVDNNAQTAHLLAQFIWHFIEAYSDKTEMFPESLFVNVKKYMLNLEHGDTELIFYNNPDTGHWWFSLPVKEHPNENVLVACSHSDYLLAMKNEIPDRWWIMFEKINFK